MHSKSCVAEHGENFHVAQSQQTKDFSFEQASHFVLVYRVHKHRAHLLNNWPILSLQRKLAALMASIRPGPDFTCSGQASLSRQNSPLLSSRLQNSAAIACQTVNGDGCTGEHGPHDIQQHRAGIPCRIFSG